MSMNFDQLLNQIEKVKLIKAFHGNNPDNVGVLTAINQQLMILEEDTNDYDRFLASEVIQLENMATMLKLIRAQKESLTYLLSKVPQNEIDATSKITSQTTYTDLEKVPNGLDTPRLSKAVEDDTKKDQMKETPKRPKFQKRIEIDEVTLDEFNLLPKYQVGRLTVPKINEHIQSFNTLIRDKFLLITHPKQKMSKAMRDVYFEHMQLENDDTRGYMFITEKDLKEKRFWSQSKFNFGTVSRNILVILRSLGRIRESRGSGHTRIIIL